MAGLVSVKISLINTKIGDNHCKHVSAAVGGASSLRSQQNSSAQKTEDLKMFKELLLLSMVVSANWAAVINYDVIQNSTCEYTNYTL